MKNKNKKRLKSAIFLNKNRRGQQLLSEETFRILIAILCLVVLVGGAFYIIFNVNQGKGNLQLANSSLTSIQNSITSGYPETKIYSPSNWFLSSWPRKAMGKPNVLPKICSDKGWTKCLCICNADSGECGNQGVDGICINNDFTVNPGSESQGTSNIIQISNPPLFLAMTYSPNTIKQESELDMARISLNSLISDVNAGKAQSSSSIKPVGWNIASYPRTTASGLLDWGRTKNYLPKMCLSAGWQKCLCIIIVDDSSAGDSNNVVFCEKSDIQVIGNSGGMENIIKITDNFIVSINKNTIQERK